MKLKPRKKRKVPYEAPDPERQREIEEAFASVYLRVHNAMSAYKMVCPEVSDYTAMERGKALMEKPLVKMLIAEYEDRARQRMPEDVFYDIIDQMMNADRSRILECETWEQFKALPLEVRLHMADAYVDSKGKIRFKFVSIEKILEIKQRMYLNESGEKSPIQAASRELLEQMIRGDRLRGNRD